MRTQLGWRFLLACLVPMSLVPILRPTEGVSLPTLEMVRGEVQRAAAAGWPLELVEAEGTAEQLRAQAGKLAGAGRRTSHVLLSEEAVLFVPSADFLALPRPTRWREFGKWMTTATTVKDLNSTIRTITWVYLATLMEAKVIEHLPPPAPLPYVAAPTASESPAGSVDWGLPVALIIALTMSALKKKLGAVPSVPHEQGELSKTGSGPVARAQETEQIGESA